MIKSAFGIIGLGVMGKSIGLNIAEKGFALSVYNRTENNEAHVVKTFLTENKAFKNIMGFTELSKFVDSLERPRQILIMIKAGDAIDYVIEQLLPFLSEGDIIIDGGNSHYLDTKKRTLLLKKKKITFIGCGISGGEEGARKGPSLMPGGTMGSYNIVAPILEKIAAKDINGNPCCTFIGPEGAGHFIKMVHNGIEYAEMQLLAELYALLSASLSNSAIATLFSNWNTTDLSSYLLEITIDILNQKSGKQNLLDLILDKAQNKGTGSWSSKAAFNLGSPNTMMSSAVFARYVSSFKEQRVSLSKHIKASKKPKDVLLDFISIENAYRSARIINHHQGFTLMQLASKGFNWNLDLSEIARIWTNGCIIRSHFMETTIAVFKKNDNFLDDSNILATLIASEKYFIKTIQYSLSCRVAFDTFSSAYNYWIAITTENLPANLIQAQRDYFGAHTYNRRDASATEFFHTNWLKI